MRNAETNPISLFFKAMLQNHVALIATMLILTSCYLWIEGKPFPDFLEKLDLIIISYCFGSKVGRQNQE